MSGRVAIGVGCRKGCSADIIEMLIRRAVAASPDSEPLAIFTLIDKQGEPGLVEAANRLGLVLKFLPRAALRAQAPRVHTAAPYADAEFGVPSVAEAAALAGAGAGGVLIVTRIAEGGATCAIAGAAP